MVFYRLFFHDTYRHSMSECLGSRFKTWTYPDHRA